MLLPCSQGQGASTDASVSPGKCGIPYSSPRGEKGPSASLARACVCVCVCAHGHHRQRTLRSGNQICIGLEKEGQRVSQMWSGDFFFFFFLSPEKG